jgi:hypothetical protein
MQALTDSGWGSVPLKQMNGKRYVVFAVAIALILLTFAFPPFQDVHPYGGAKNAGYGFIFLPPQSHWAGGRSSVDTNMLLTQWVGIVLLAGISWFLVGFEKRRS